MDLTKNLRVVLLVLMVSLSSGAQDLQVPTGTPTRWLFDFKFGQEAGLGYKFPSTLFGLLVERPLGNHFELQGSIGYSPDKKVITNDGNSLLGSAFGIAWLTRRVGISGGIEGSRLWTSQFNKGSWGPGLGAVIRDPIYDPGRLTVIYAFPTGCVWATPSNPCRIQSNRLQGFQLTQEFQTWSHLRLGVEFDIYHFCDQSNPNERSIPRTCQVVTNCLASIRYQFHGQTKRDYF